MNQTTGFRGHLLTVLTAVLVSAVVGFGLMYEGGAFRDLTGNPYKVSAVLPTAAALTPGARVTMAGAQVGRVTGISRKGAGAVVNMEIDNHRVTPVPADSKFTLRLRTAVGEDYISIDPGRSSQKLASGSVVAISQAGDYVDVDQLLSVLQGSTKQKTRQLFEALGGALGGQGQNLNRVVGGFNGTITPLAHIVSTLHNDRSQVSRLVQQLGDLASAAGERGASIMQLGRDGLATFQAVAARDQALRRTLAVLPSTLSQVKDTTSTLSSVTNRAAPVVSNLAAALHDVQPAVSYLQPAATEARSVVSQLGSASGPLRQTLDKVQALSGPAQSALPAVRDTFCQVDPMLTYAKPYTGDIISFVNNFGSAVNAYDSIGHLVRIQPILGENSINGLPPDVSRAAFTLLHAGVLGDSTGLNWDPYPAPGQMGKSTALGSQHLLGPADLAKTGYVYPHVVADC